MNTNVVIVGSILVLLVVTLLSARVATAEGRGSQITIRELAPGEQLTTEQLAGQLHDIGIVLSPELEETHRRNLESYLLAGYIDASESDPRARYIEKRMEERVAAANVAGVGMSPQSLGFYDMNDTAPEVVEGRFRPSTVLPAPYLKAESSRT